MEVRLDKVRESPYRWSQEWLPEEHGFQHPDVVDIGEVSWQGELRFTAPDYLLTASYEYEQTLVCTRCLTPVEQEVEGSFELLFSPRPRLAEAGRSELDDPFDEGGEAVEIELSEEDLGVVSIPEDTEELDLDPYIVEQLEVNVPMKPLCHPDCAGLCPECGADLNESDCDCESEPIDPRWEKLKQMKARLAETE